MPDVPPLHEQEASGQLFEMIQKLVDGVLEDIRGGHLKTQAEARDQLREAIRLNKYVASSDLAADVLKYGVEELRKDERTIFKIQIQELARSVLVCLVETELGKRSEIRKLPK